MAKTYTLSFTSQIIDASNVTIGKVPTSGTDTGISQWVDDEIQVATGSTDLSISLAGITAKYVHLEFSGGAVSVKLNSAGNTAITITPSSATPGVLCVAGGSVTGIFVTNASGSLSTIRRLLAA